MTQEALKLALEALKDLLDQTEPPPDKNCSCHIAPPCSDCVDYSGVRYAIEQANKTITAIKEALAKEKTLQALHSENERLGLYKDAYAQPEQEPVNYEKLAALGWQSIECPFCGSAGAQAFPQRTWVGLAAEDRLTAKYMQDAPDGIEAVIDYIEAKLKEKNGD